MQKQPQTIVNKNLIIQVSLNMVIKTLNQQLKQRQFGFKNASKAYRAMLNQMDQDDFKVKEAQLLAKQIDFMIQALVRAPKHWVIMLKNQQIHAEQEQYIDLHSFTLRIFKNIAIQAKQTSPYFIPFAGLIIEQIFVFLQEISIIICEYYNFGRKMLIQQMDQLSTNLEKSRILNVYTLFKILRDITLHCKKKIVEFLLEGLFMHINAEQCQYFSHYVIQKFQILQMKTETKQDRQKKLDITQRILMSNKVSWRQAVNQQGQHGIFLQLHDKQQNEQQDGKKQKYIIRLDSEENMLVMNCNSLTKNWKVKKQAERNFEILNMVQNTKQLANKFRNTNISLELKQLTAIDHFSTIGGSLGSCLANIDKYQSMGHFMTDVSRKAVIGSSFTYVLASVPIMSYIFIAGGFTYSFYYIFSNKENNLKKKFQQTENMGIDAVSSLGSGLLGAFIGQQLIPVPFLGAFIGGVIGSLIGQFGVRTASNYIQSARFKQTIKDLLLNINQNGYWQPDQKIFSILGLNKQFFYESIPVQLKQKMGYERLWLTLICFTLLSFYESEKRAKFMKKKIEQLKSQKRVLKVHEIKDNQQYNPSINMICTMQFLENQQVIYLRYMKPIETMITHMFTRLK